MSIGYSIDYAKEPFKAVVDLLNSDNIILKSLEEIELSLLKTRKKIEIFSGTMQNGYYISIFIIRQKSRFLKKNALELIDLKKKLEELEDHIYKNKLLIISSPLCSKANFFLTKEGWKIIEVKDDTL